MHPLSLSLLLLIPLHIDASIIPFNPNCFQPLGMENKEIRDSQIKGEGVQAGKEVYYARLNNKEAWCIPRGTGSSTSYREDIHIIIDLDSPKLITAIALQGHGDFSIGTSILLHYWIGSGFFPYSSGGNPILRIIEATGDNYYYLVFDAPIVTSKIKITPEYDSNTKCFRFEIYGCRKFSIPEYLECNKTDESLITTVMDPSQFNQSSYVTKPIRLDASYLAFDKTSAWCVQLDPVPKVSYSQWALVDLSEKFMIYKFSIRRYTPVSLTEILPESFKLDYSIGDDVWASYEGGRELVSKDVLDNEVVLKKPLLAQFIKIRIKVTSINNTCIKLQLYGCRAVQAADLTTTPLTKPNATNNPSQKPEAARIYQYEIFDGHSHLNRYQWKDKEYRTAVNSQPKTADAEGILSGGLGCLTDGGYSPDSNPFKSPCWVGWSRQVKPTQLYFMLFLTVQTTISAITFQMYVNESMGASPIKMFTIQNSLTYKLPYTVGYACAPQSAYHLSPQNLAITIDLNNLRTKLLTIMFEYSGDWILLRQVSISQDQNAGGVKLTKARPKCVIPEKPDNSDKSSGPNIVIIVCIVLAMLFIILLAFVIYHYRTRLHTVFKTKSKPTHDVRNGSREYRSLLNPSADNSGFSNAAPVVRAHFRKESVESKNSEEVYANPSDVTVSVCDGNNGNKDKPGYAHVVHAQYKPASSSGDSNRITYAQPSLKQQYAEPNHLPKNNPIYQGSAIYASTYENPYKAVVASTLYADPDAIVLNRSGSQKNLFKIFPRDQLQFQEKIGDGQFGEVHIAEATGLDEIYGTIGHYNSWGLPDTALVAVKLLKSVDKHVEEEFMKEVEIMSRLKHENVVRLLGVSKDEPMLMVVEYMENGDLNQFLHDRKPCDSDNFRVSQIAPNMLPLDTLLHMAQQIASGMKYLHAEAFIHRDLATRNCLVGPAYQVKISDFGMSRYLYSKHYYRVEGKAVLPIRWMAPECLFYGKFTQTTDTWSFGITLWEILTFARETPYSHLGDPEVIENACESVQNPNKPFKVLPRPPFCTDDLYDVMLKCWKVKPDSRPTFAFLHQFFTDICNSSEMDI